MNIVEKMSSYKMIFDPHIIKDIQILKNGHLLDNFEIELSNKRTVDLYSILKQGPLLLFFIKGTWCMFCRSHLERLKKWYSNLKYKKVALIVVSSEPFDVINQYAKDNELPYVFASDPNFTLGKLFGVYREDKTFNQASTFLIDVDKKIKLALSEKRTDDHFSRIEKSCEACGLK